MTLLYSYVGPVAGPGTLLTEGVYQSEVGLYYWGFVIFIIIIIIIIIMLCYDMLSELGLYLRRGLSIRGGDYYVMLCYGIQSPYITRCGGAQALHQDAHNIYIYIYIYNIHIHTFHTLYMYIYTPIYLSIYLSDLSDRSIYLHIHTCIYIYIYIYSRGGAQALHQDAPAGAALGPAACH